MHTTTRVLSGGLTHRVVGAQRETITDVALSGTGPETLTAQELGLSVSVDTASAAVLSGTATAMSADPDKYGSAITLTGAEAGSTVRVTARGR